MDNRHWRKLAVALALTMLIGAAGPATAESTKTRAVDVSVDFYDPGVAGASNPAADCSVDSDGLCSAGFDGVATMMGTWTGSTKYRARTTPTPDALTGDLRFEVWETFTGTVDGCGRGTFRWHLVGSAAFSKFDPVTQTVPFSFRVWLVDGSGTGGLAGITGSAAGQGRFGPMLDQTGHFTGAATCAVSGNVRAASQERRARSLLPRTG